MMNEGLGRTVSLLSLSDAFRRRARYEQPAVVRALVNEARHFSANLTYHYPEYGDTADNRQVAQNLQVRLLTMAALAGHLGATTVELPVSRDNEIAVRLIEDKVLPGLKLPVSFTFQKAAYGRDLSAVGKVDPNIRTVLDQGYRGHASFADGFIYRPENR
jgi:hypothetical protein